MEELDWASFVLDFDVAFSSLTQKLYQPAGLRITELWHSLLGYGRDNTIGIFGKFPLAVTLTARVILLRINFMGSK
jgi:hypothetical protein